MKLFKSKSGFTLIELLVVIGILAVLAAIAIPSVAGLIDRANVSADKTNANEMTNAVERFTSEYELYCQDIASGVIKDANSDGVPDDMDGAQGRVYNVTKAVTRADITALESDGLNGKIIDRDTKYPTNLITLQKIIENYAKTSSTTFEPKQSDCSYWYNPDCGLIVVAKTNATVIELNALVVSGKDAKGNELKNNANWNNITTKEEFNNVGTQDAKVTIMICYVEKVGTITASPDTTWGELVGEGLEVSLTVEGAFEKIVTLSIKDGKIAHDVRIPEPAAPNMSPISVNDCIGDYTKYGIFTIGLVGIQET